MSPLPSQANSSSPNPILAAILAVREADGARTSDRFDYQAHVAISKILQVHDEGNAYRAFFDHIDDLLILDDEVDPTCIKIYQIKGQESEGRIITYIVRGAGRDQASQNGSEKNDEHSREARPGSAAGKLYWSYDRFKQNTACAGFIVNAPIRAKVQGGKDCSVDVEEVTGDMLEDSEWQRIATALSEDYPGVSVDNIRGIFRIETTSLGIRDHEETVRGLIARRMINRGAVPDEAPVWSACNLLIKRIKSGFNVAKQYTDVEKLIREKSIGRDEVEEILQNPVGRQNFDKAWDICKHALFNMGWEDLDVMRIHQLCLEYKRRRISGDREVENFSILVNERLLPKKKEIKRIVDALNLVSDCALSAPELEDEELYTISAKLVEVCEVIYARRK